MGEGRQEIEWALRCTPGRVKLQGPPTRQVIRQTMSWRGGGRGWEYVQGYVGGRTVHHHRHKSGGAVNALWWLWLHVVREYREECDAWRWVWVGVGVNDGSGERV